jgi:predicted dinucleotide-binding enzyme
MRIAFIGVGQVGAPLADHLQRLGHTVVVAAKDPASASVQKALARNPQLQVASPPEAVAGAQVVFLATPYEANAAAVQAVAPELQGKILVDCTNPVGANLSHGLGSARSGSEVLQELVPGCEVVKAFTIYGFENFEDSAN